MYQHINYRDHDDYKIVASGRTLGKAVMNED
jgi:hypothetical protein